MKRILSPARVIWAIAAMGMIAPATSGQNQTFEEYRRGLHKSFQDYRSSVFDRYDEFLSNAWAEYEQFRGESRYSTPKPSKAPVAEETLPDTPAPATELPAPPARAEGAEGTPSAGKSPIVSIPSVPAT
ncbi:MAG: hypothetical protein LIP02_00280, partial [Bacteroidales bacterium]|nr:hypothetical protein [Bacteroidales bacterium]